ncbi:uncharacterized protein FSUBG_1589 [Fusarium subglutinans]|uniref:Uncharacterized protein n=1 Tax=Gibberella subglutinans TaxID=42677 RepID=A0A8H5QB82_GIBSU|nr:uncharacterized protein FSUBG_1589 [Fusarium subglutinans]KAF5612270.1 hypothetical protein FSUBG_1589 [Fusarium subglutinans]
MAREVHEDQALTLRVLTTRFYESEFWAISVLFKAELCFTQEPAVTYLGFQFADLEDPFVHTSATPNVSRHYTDKNYIRGKHIEDLIGENAVRLNWSERDRIIMTFHLARNQLHKGDLKQVNIREILDRLGLLEYSLADTSMSYHSVCVAKITSALQYRLKRLHEDGHVMETFTKPYKTQWKPYTRAWREDNWDGNTSVVVSLESDSITSLENSSGQDLAQRMAQLSINTGQGHKTASAEAQDQQRLLQEQQRLATEQELARNREERLQMAQQRQQ